MVSFVIPFHNEEKNCPIMINRVLQYARKSNLNFEIIPVDDRSTDKTKKILSHIAQKNPRVKPVYRNDDGIDRGNTMGRALIAGTTHARGDYIIWTMGDMADDTKTYTDIIKYLKQGYDMVFGSRYMPGGSRGDLDRMKAFLSSWGTKLARVIYRIPIHDITNAFRGFNKNVFDKLKLESSGFSISPEFAIKAYLAGFKLGEVPTVYTNRLEGVSSFKIFNMTKTYLTIYWRIFFKYKIKKLRYDFIKG